MSTLCKQYECWMFVVLGSNESTVMCLCCVSWGQENVEKATFWTSRDTTTWLCLELAVIGLFYCNVNHWSIHPLTMSSLQSKYSAYAISLPVELTHTYWHSFNHIFEQGTTMSHLKSHGSHWSTRRHVHFVTPVSVIILNRWQYFSAYLHCLFIRSGQSIFMNNTQKT